MGRASQPKRRLVSSEGTIIVGGNRSRWSSQYIRDVSGHPWPIFTCRQRGFRSIVGLVPWPRSPTVVTPGQETLAVLEHGQLARPPHRPAHVVNPALRHNAYASNLAHIYEAPLRVVRVPPITSTRMFEPRHLKWSGYLLYWSGYRPITFTLKV